MRYYLSFFVFYLMVTNSLGAEPRMLDRLIVEINGKSFSQRQIETYHALRTIVAGGGPSKALTTSDNWKTVVENFKNEMLVYASIEADQQRLDSFQADQSAMQAAEREIQKVQLEDRIILEHFKKLALTEADIRQNLLTIFRIQAFVRSRVQVLSQESDPSRRELLEVDSSSDWFASLLRSSSYRFYDRAKDYVLLQARKKD